jgi:hypothetical protein
MGLSFDARIFGMMEFWVMTLRGQVGIGSAHSHGDHHIRSTGVVEPKMEAAIEPIAMPVDRKKRLAATCCNEARAGLRIPHHVPYFGKVFPRLVL